MEEKTTPFSSSVPFLASCRCIELSTLRAGSSSPPSADSLAARSYSHRDRDKGTQGNGLDTTVFVVQPQEGVSHDNPSLL